MNAEEWHSDIELTDEIVKNCIESQFKELSKIEKFTCIGEGWDNKAFLINEKIIFRFPRRKSAIELIEKENNILKNIRKFIDIQIPNPKYIGLPSQLYPYSFHGYEIIKGLSACHANLSHQERIESLVPVANFLKSLHKINEKQALSMQIKPQILNRSDSLKAIEYLEIRVEKIIDKNILNVNKKCFQNELLTAKKINLPFNDRCLIHGDLYFRHLLFDEGKLSGIIDWGDAGTGQKAVDLSIIWGFYPQKYHQKFFEIYGEVEDGTWQYARFLGLYIAFTVMLYANDIGDNLMRKEATDTIMRINPDFLNII